MATSIVKLHTFSHDSDVGPPCYILQVDEFHCLLDCGWTEKLDSDYVMKLSKWAKHVDAVLLSHQGIRHLGLLPYLVGSCGLKCPVYATTPVYKMGQLTLYDFFQSKYASQDFPTFNLDDVDAAFELVTQVKYQQTVNLHGRGQGICITPLPSGHTLGGTIWKLVKEDVDIVYAVDFNHKKERHLNGATFDACMRPHLLILDASNALYTHPRRKDRDENLRQYILKSLRRGGNVLVVVDTAGRSLEIAHFLEQCWLNQDSGLMAYGLAMLNFVTYNVVDFARSMVEWMSEKVMRTFEDQRTNPFHFRHMQLCHTLDQLDSVPEPKVVLATLADLSCGYSRQLFAEWADNDLNTVILTTRDICSPVPATGDNQNVPLLTRLIGLATGDPDAQNNLARSSTGTLILPFSLSQRLTVSQIERMENELPRLRNLAHPDVSDQVESSIDVPMMNDPMSPGVTPREDAPSPPAVRDAAADGDQSTISGNASHVSTEANVTHSEPMDTASENISVSPVKTTLATVISSTGAASSLSAPHLERDVGASLGSRLLASTQLLTGRPPVAQIIAGVPPPDWPLLTGSGSQLTFGRHQPGYDIYPGLHNHAGGQFFRMAKRTQLLFPQIDRKVHWDEYGGHVDRDMFASNERAPTAVVEGKQKRSKPSASVPTETDSVSLLPSSLLTSFAASGFQFDDSEKTRCVTHQLEIPLRCELVFLDFEGRSDGEAMKRIVTGLRPQELILVGHNQAAVHHLASYCSDVMLLDPSLVHTPNPGDVIDCTKEGDIYQARMKDSLVSSLKFTKIRDYELAWVEATVSLVSQTSDHMNNSESPEHDATVSPDELKTRTPLATDQLPVLNLPTCPIGPHKTVFVNEPKLSDLKQLLLTRGLQAEFVSGVLVVDNCVAIKRSEVGKLLLEGLLSRTYFDVRQVLYQQFAIL